MNRAELDALIAERDDALRMLEQRDERIEALIAERDALRACATAATRALLAELHAALRSEQ